MKTDGCKNDNMLACTATDTLAARAPSKGTLIQWSAQSTHQALGLAPDATTFRAETRKRSASATHCQRFLEAVHFTAGVLGLPLDTECIAVRMTGSAERMTNTKRIIVKAPPLSRKAPLSVGALHLQPPRRLHARAGGLLALQGFCKVGVRQRRTSHRRACFGPSRER